MSRMICDNPACELHIPLPNNFMKDSAPYMTMVVSADYSSTNATKEKRIERFKFVRSNTTDFFLCGTCTCAVNLYAVK